MLILTRKPGEKIIILPDVTITVLALKGGQVRIGVTAPAEKRIYREEIYDQILDENRKAAEGAAIDSSLDQLSGSWMGGAKAGQGAASGEGSAGRRGDQPGQGKQGGVAANPSVFLRRKSVSSAKDVERVGPPKKGGDTES
jgi:carbon storage regulator